MSGVAAAYLHQQCEVPSPRFAICGQKSVITVNSKRIGSRCRGELPLFPEIFNFKFGNIPEFTLRKFPQIGVVLVHRLDYMPQSI